MSVTKQFKFDAAHFLKDYEGDCARIHGHSFRGEVEVVLTDWGETFNTNFDMVVDFKKLKSVLQKNVVDILDHQLLNDVVAFNPTAENLCKWIRREVELGLNAGLPMSTYAVVRVRVWESDTSYAELK